MHRHKATPPRPASPVTGPRPASLADAMRAVEARYGVTLA